MTYRFFKIAATRATLTAPSVVRSAKGFAWAIAEDGTSRRSEPLRITRSATAVGQAASR